MHRIHVLCAVASKGSAVCVRFDSVVDLLILDFEMTNNTMVLIAETQLGF